METEVAHFRYRDEAVDLAAPRGDHVARLLRRGHFYELDLLEAIRELGVRGTYVDCGAHVGNHSVYFARFCSAGRVVAVECNEELIPHLARNVSALEEVSVVLAYVGDGEPVRWVPGPEHNVGMGRTEPGGDLRTYKLSELFEDGAALVKLDLEGAEERVLRASAGWLREHRPVVVAEAEDPRGVDAILRPLGYRREGPYALTPTWIWRVS